MILAIGLLFADVTGSGHLSPLKGAVYVLAALSLITVAQRIAHVRRELSKPAV